MSYWHIAIDIPEALRSSEYYRVLFLGALLLRSCCTYCRDAAIASLKEVANEYMVVFRPAGVWLTSGEVSSSLLAILALLALLADQSLWLL